ncbi:hypothetical protein NL676_019615 [Syzygium grande]|nr:hypothetical protein NL676_019615 [Syzygium grande]
MDVFGPKAHPRAPPSPTSLLPGSQPPRFLSKQRGVPAASREPRPASATGERDRERERERESREHDRLAGAEAGEGAASDECERRAARRTGVRRSNRGNRVLALIWRNDQV